MPYIPQYTPPGTKFGAWTVISEHRINTGRRIRRRADCICDCGKRSFVLVTELKHGHSTNCGCKRHVVRQRHARQQHIANPTARIDQSLRQKYGINLATKQALAIQQDNKCLICGHETRLVIDHNHTTKQVRGLLCSLCNWGLGNFRDNPTILQKAIDYLNAELQ
mgnify:FL=1